MATIGPAPDVRAQHILTLTGKSASSTLHKLATGLRIGSGAEDPAGLITSEKLKAALSALQAEANAVTRADTVANSADVALGEISDLLGEAETLAIANANTAGMSKAEREANQMELDSIRNSVSRIASSTTFNSQRLLDGSATISAAGESFTIDSVAASDLGNVELDGETYSFNDTGTNAKLNIDDGDIAGALVAIRAAQDQVSTLRADLGAFQSDVIKPQYAIIAETYETVTDAESDVSDVNYALETANLARLETLSQAGMMTAGLAADPTAVLSLIA